VHRGLTWAYLRPHIGQNYRGNPSVDSGHAIMVACPAECQFRHVKIPAVTRAAQPHEIVALHTQIVKAISEVAPDHFLLEEVMSCRHRCMGCKHRVGCRRLQGCMDGRGTSPNHGLLQLGA